MKLGQAREAQPPGVAIHQVRLTSDPSRLEGETDGLRNLLERNHTLRGQLGELLSHRELLWMLTQREVKVRYKQTFLGVLWAVLQPFSLMVVLTVLVSHFIGVGSGPIPYPLLAYSGLLPWTFFSTALSFATTSLISQSHIITKVYFPREVVPLACVLAALVDFFFASLVFGGMLAFYGLTPSWSALYAVPLLAIQIVFTTALALLLSGVAVVYRDVRFTVPLLLQLGMFATPILYPLAIVPEGIRGAYLALNPMAVVVDGYRQALILGQPVPATYLASAAFVALLLLWLAYRTFKRLDRTFADLV